MYAPHPFEIQDDDLLFEFLKQHPFGSLITSVDEAILITSIPFSIQREENHTWILEGHLAILNEQSKHLLPYQKAKLLFLQNGTYVSSQVYGHDNVPTYNYQSVQLSGHLDPLNEEETLRHLSDLTHQMERKRENPMAWETLNQELIHQYLKEIKAFRFRVDKKEAAFKLSQNRNASDFESILQDLTKHNCPTSTLEAMKKHCPHKG